MSEEADTSTSPTTTVVEPAPAPVRQSRVTQVAAWVGIVAGVTFVVAVVFFSGFVLGKQSGGGHHRGGPDRESGQFHRGGPPMGPPHMLFPGGPGNQQGPQQGGPATPPRP
ncbi:MAG: hypothetical protein ACSLE3_15740 [Microbacteriaceae bacterium]